MPRTPAELVKELVDAGVHFGHRVSRWNPKMEPYIHGKRNMIHIIDVKETVKGLLRAKKFLGKIVSDGKDVLFVGTKRQARHAVEDESKRSGMHYVAERWLGGTLTNFATIRKRLSRLDELEGLFTTGGIETYSKKMKATLGREMKKIKANLEGIRRMEKMPGAMFIVDTRREHIAVKEARKLGVPVVALIDTDSDPDLVDLPIPGNDDAMKAVEIVMQELADAIIESKGARPTAKEDSGPQGPRRRSTRSQFRADEGGAAAAGAGASHTEGPATAEPAAVEAGEPVAAGQA
jgi:small subunit ribosomal protein S2